MDPGDEWWKKFHIVSSDPLGKVVLPIPTLDCAGLEILVPKGLFHNSMAASQTLWAASTKTQAGKERSFLGRDNRS